MSLKRSMGIALALVTLFATTGCATGFSAHTNSQKPSGNGRFATAGTLEIRDATIVSDPKDPGKGTLLVTIYNSGQENDAVVGASSSEVASQASQSIPIGALRSVQIGYNSAIHIALSSASGSLIPGNLVPLTFHFANTPSLPMELLVNANDGIYAGVKIQ
jgi:copper(I)-binding protein